MAKKKVVILIEDDPDVTLISKMLLEEQHEVVTYKYPLAAMTKEAWVGVDIAVLDLMLPGIDGEVMMEWLSIHVPHVKRIIFSARSVSKLSQRTKELAYAILQKPGDIMKLGEVL